MGYMLDSIFRKCEFVNGDVHRLFDDIEIIQWDTKIKQEVQDFKQNLTDEDLKIKFESFCNLVDDLLNTRDAYLCSLLVQQGMTINMRLITEILSGK
nr:hypothetical protein [uncultured Aminipila sp.]